MKLTHPDAPKQVVETTEQYAEMYKSQGWVEVTEKAKPDPKD